jgi:tetraacyldisaccharide 4'-kinase
VLVHARNSNAVLETMFATWMIGATWVPTNFRLTPPEVAYLAVSSGASVHIFDAAFPDHAPWTPARLKALEALAAAHDAGLVTTTKDWVRMPPDWRARVTAWPVRAVFGDTAVLDALLGRLPRR